MHFPTGDEVRRLLPDSTLLFCEGPVWIGVRVEDATSAQILDALARLTRYVRVAAAHAPRGSANGSRFRSVCACGGSVMMHGTGANWGDLKCTRCGAEYCQDCGDALVGNSRCPNVGPATEVG